jgi:hypothetical protein
LEFIMNKAKLFIALNTFVTARVSLVQAVIDAGYPTVESARPDIMAWIVTRVADVELKEQGSGRLVFVGEGAATARNVLRDVNLNLAGTTRREATSPVESKKAAPLTKAQQAAIAALLLAFKGDKKAAKAAF